METQSRQPAQSFDFPRWDKTKQPEIYEPFGLVLLPSSWIDECGPEWIDVIKKHVGICVNLAFFSKRLRENQALPNHAAWLDNPHRILKRNGVKDLVQFENYFRDEAITVWGGYDYWFRKKRIWQGKQIIENGEHMPIWKGPAEVKDETDPDVFTVAGQYTSFAACNIIAYMLGFTATIFVLGNKGYGKYCKLILETNPAFWEGRNTSDTGKVPSADDHQWSCLYQGAQKTRTQIIHVEPSQIGTVPVISEAEALGILSG